MTRTGTSRRGDWIQTVTGRRFWPLDPHPGDVFLADIAHALSLLCRFGGHCRWFYSVAQHSVLVSRVVGRRASEQLGPSLLPWQQLALVALLHDASEAYLVDVPRPIKRSLPAYREAETAVEAAIFTQFGLRDAAGEAAALVKTADNILLATEARDLMNLDTNEWADCRNYEPEAERIAPWDPVRAKAEFLKRFEELTVSYEAWVGESDR